MGIHPWTVAARRRESLELPPIQIGMRRVREQEAA